MCKMSARHMTAALAALSVLLLGLPAAALDPIDNDPYDYYDTGYDYDYSDDWFYDYYDFNDDGFDPYYDYYADYDYDADLFDWEEDGLFE